jgi:hypothetical protein
MSHLAATNLKLNQFDAAKRLINEAIGAVETAGERLWEVEAYRIAGEIESKSPNRNMAKAEEYF